MAYKITGMKVNDTTGRDPGELWVMAHFDFEDGTYSFEGAAVLRYPSGVVCVALPMCHKSKEVMRRSRVADRGAKLALEDAAFRAYMAMGGDADLILSQRTTALDGWPLDPKHAWNGSRMDKRLADGVRAIEPEYPWADMREEHDKLPSICLPPPINKLKVTKRTEPGNDG